MTSTALQIAPLMIGVVLAQLVPGPNLMAVASTAVRDGRAAGLFTTAGIATGVLVWAATFSAGAGTLLTAHPEALTAMRVVGGGYLLYLGGRAVLRAGRGGADPFPTGSVPNASKNAYRRGLAVVLTNPKAAMMWVAIALFLASAQMGPSQYLIVGPLAAFTAAVIYGGYALLFSTGAIMRGYTRAMRWVEVGFGAVFGSLGLALLIDAWRDLRLT